MLLCFKQIMRPTTRNPNSAGCEPPQPKILAGRGRPPPHLRCFGETTSSFVRARSSIAPLSRSDHNAATPSRMIQTVSRECDRHAEGHYVAANRPAEPRFGRAREPRRGRSAAKWLDRTADRRTIARRDALGARDRGARRRTRKAIDARRWKKGRRRRALAAAVRNSERVRAHLYEREFRGKPVTCVDSARERRRAHWSNHAAHSVGVRDRRGPSGRRRTSESATAMEVR